MTDFDEGRRAVLVTGASGGIGAAVVRLLAERGYEVFAAVRRSSATPAEPPSPASSRAESRAETPADGLPVGAAPADTPAVDGLPEGVRVIPMDVTNPMSVTRAAQRVGRETEGLHAVINNAGVIVQGPLELVPPTELQRQFAVNTFGPVYVTQAFLPLLRAGRGRVINISAPSGRIPFPFMAPLSASKAALESISDALRVELAPWRIPVVIVEPGATATAIFSKADHAAQAALEPADPRRVALYAHQLAAFRRAMARQNLGPVDAVARTIVTAVEASRPRRLYVTGSGARSMSLLAHLPAGLRQRLVALALGLRGARPGPSA